MAHVTFEIHTIMEGGAFFERILSDTIPRSNTDEIKGKAYIHPLLDQTEKHTVFDINKDWYILFNGYFMPFGCRKEVRKVSFSFLPL